MLRNGSFNYHSLQTRRAVGPSISVFTEKPIPTEHDLLFSSNYPQIVKEGMFSCLFHRVHTVSQGVNMVTGEGGVLEGSGVSRHICKDSQEAQYTAAEPTEAPKAKDIYSLCGRTDLGRGTGMQMIQHQDGLLIIIHTSQTADVS